MAARRAVQAKSLASQANLSSSQHSLAVVMSARQQQQQQQNSRLKSTSMTNLNQANNNNNNNSLNHSKQHEQQNSLARPASRSALDSIHKGMNAKFTHVQSKVLLQNIRPQAPTSSASKIPNSSLGAGTPSPRPQNVAIRKATPTGLLGTPSRSGPSSSAAAGQSDRSQLINRIKSLQEQLERQSEARDELRAELERERQDKQEQVAQIKLELQEKAAETERQSEDYHRKLLEAYELADQNRRAADSVLSESRQREEELRKRIDELDGQLAELKEFVVQKEEMVGKMGELRDQMAREREHYEEKTRTLNQMFDKEKISDHMRVDQNSNYFKRTKGSLESTDSIHQLGADSNLVVVMALNQQQQQQQQQQPAGQSYTRSEHDMLYGSKLSTRMQDGARTAWKKSRKFASSLVTGSLGGLSACRRHNQMTSTKSTTRKTFVQQPAAGASSQVVTQQPREQEQHTSVVEVGDFMQQQQQQQQASQSASVSHVESVQSEGEQQQSLIRVDENNKLTIVTKFNDCPAAAVSSASSSSAGERCESSSSGRGTASSSSACDSSDSATGSQNGDASEQSSSSSSSACVKDDSPTAATNATTDFQCHKRKSSLAFKSSALLPADAKTTFKSFFAPDRKSTNDATVAMTQSLATVASYDEQTVPRLSSFKSAAAAAAATETMTNTTTNEKVKAVVDLDERAIELAH